MNPLRLITSRDKSRNEAARILELALEQAKAGQLKAVAIAAVRSDGSLDNAWNANEHRPALIGAITCLQIDYAMDDN